jgi:hypothetical protein
MFCRSTHINETGVMVVESNKNYKKKKSTTHLCIALVQHYTNFLFHIRVIVKQT